MEANVNPTDDRPLVSVGLPAYKDEFLSRAIDSVLQQTYRNLELIIVNDCSPHDIQSVVSRYDDARIKYFVNERNVGAKDPACNWNECLKKAGGEYFCLICDDDVYEPTFIEEMLKLSEKYPQCNVFHSSVKVFNTKDEVIQVFPKSPEWENTAEYIKNVSERKRKQTISEWMYKREHIVSLGGYSNLPLAWGSDYLSIMRFSVDGGIASTDKELAVFRRSDINITMHKQGQCETKVQALSLYRRELQKLVNGNEDLSRAVSASCIESIIDFEHAAILSEADSNEFKRIVRHRKQYEVSSSVVLKMFVKRVIKSVFRKK